MKKILFASLLFASALANAFSVEPMIAEMQPAKANNQIMFKIKNESSKPLPVQANPLIISFDKNGNEVNTDSNDLMVLPLTATIAPNSFQTFVVRYVGDKALPTSKSYRISFETAKIATGGTGNSMQMEYQFLTFVHVLPKNPVVNVLQKRTYQKGGKWFLELNNTGNSGAFLPSMKWKVGTSKNLVSISEEELRKHMHAEFLMPGDTQSFEFKPFKGVPAKSMQVAVSN